jgi:phosphatidylserine/phosphatidylglycerophosphate/cardiolipin synthase-like enzyme
MDEAAVIGGLLFQALEPNSAAELLERYLILPSQVGEEALRASGIEPALADAIRGVLPSDHRAIHLACVRGAAWVLGYRSAPRLEKWELVASIPPGMQPPPCIRRSTAETLIGLITHSETSVRIAAAYVDRSGLELLADSLSAATARGVSVEIFESRIWQPGVDAVRELEQSISKKGNPMFLRLSQLLPEIALAHLKVVVIDEKAAYVGSANITGAGLRGRNVELGVLLYGSGVNAVAAILDACRSNAPLPNRS